MGVVIIIFGIFVLFGGLFVPLPVILADPGIVPAPESFIAGWIILVGIVVAVWPRSRKKDEAL